jgi:predicted GIY-YIG superfamily endonuclease
MPRFHCVCILESRSHPDRPYVGMTTDLARRLTEQNEGKSKHNAKFRPWTLRVAIAFPSPFKAAAFERHLKSHSGRAFARKRFWVRSRNGERRAAPRARYRRIGSGPDSGVNVGTIVLQQMPESQMKRLWIPQCPFGRECARFASGSRTRVGRTSICGSSPDCVRVQDNHRIGHRTAPHHASDALTIRRKGGFFFL